MKKILNFYIKDSIVFEIDEKYNIKSLIKFIRLSFNRLKIDYNVYTVFYDKQNLKNHQILINSLASFYKKEKNDEKFKEILLHKRKDVIIKIVKNQAPFDKNAIYISIKKLSSTEFEIVFANPKKSVYDYIKGLFLFDLLDLDRYKMIVSLNEESANLVSALIAKKSIMGYKVFFNVEEEFKPNPRGFSIDGSLKDYLNKIRHALELFGVSTIYEWDIIKKRYKKMAKKYHPDLHRNKPELIQKIYEKKFRQLKESYELLEEYYKKKK